MGDIMFSIIVWFYRYLNFNENMGKVHKELDAKWQMFWNVFSVWQIPAMPCINLLKDTT